MNVLAATLTPVRARTLRGNAPISYAIALAIGIALICTVFPLRFLFPDAAEPWRPVGDMAQHVIGQRYFISDSWHWPLLWSSSMDAPRGVNVAFVDAIPLLALPLKLLAPLLPASFEGIGLWTGISLLLLPASAVWAVRGAGEERVLPCTAAAIAAASMPVWWQRFGHAALGSQFLLLLALGCYLRLVRGDRRRDWTIAGGLQVVALLVHPYLLVMTMAIFGAAPLTLLLRGDARWRHGVVAVLITTGALLGLMALLGYFGQFGGGFFYDRYTMNLLSPFWPYRSWLFGFAPQPVAAPGTSWLEGYNYLGAGLLFGIVAALALAWRRIGALARRHAGLLLVMLAFTALAIGPRIAIGDLRFGNLWPVPGLIGEFRAAGRFFWPVSYTLLIAVIVLLARSRAARIAPVALIAVAALQFADATQFREGIRAWFRNPVPWTVNASALRAELAGQQRLTVIPSWLCEPPLSLQDGFAGRLGERATLLDVLLVASETGLPVNTMYLSRVAPGQDCADAATLAKPLTPGETRLFLPSAAAEAERIPGGAEACRTIGTLRACSLDFAGPATRNVPR